MSSPPTIQPQSGEQTTEHRETVLVHLTKVGFRSDKGLAGNQTRAFAGYLEPEPSEVHVHRGSLYCIADGWGGQRSGQYASEAATNSILDYYYSDSKQPPPQCLTDAIEFANDELRRLAGPSTAIRSFASSFAGLALV